MAPGAEQDGPGRSPCPPAQGIWDISPPGSHSLSGDLGWGKKKKTRQNCWQQGSSSIAFPAWIQIARDPRGNGIRWALRGTNGHFGAQIDVFGYEPLSEPQPGCGAAHPRCGVTPGTDPWAAAVPFGFRAVPAVPGQINPRGAGIAWERWMEGGSKAGMEPRQFTGLS